MAASPSADLGPMPPQEKWSSGDENGHGGMGPITDIDRDTSNGATLIGGDSRQDSNDDYRSVSVSGGKSVGYGEKKIKPNKVYIGGLPEHTRQEDLQNCFGKLGNIVNIELKLGYGFVEFDSREAAELSVEKYHEGCFMGNKIRVELSHGGGRTAKYTGDPGACFKCGQLGHWARECPNGPVPSRRGGHHNSHFHQDGLGSHSRDFPPPAPSSRDYPPFRDDYGRYPSNRDPRYGFDYPPPPPVGYRRPTSPPRDYRDYPGVPRRDFDDYRMRPPPPPSRAFYPPDAPGFPSRSYDGPPREIERGADRRVGHQSERYSAYPAPPTRPRTPPGPPPRAPREDFERAPARDYPQPAEYRGRPTTPPMPPTGPRYSDYPPRGTALEQPGGRYRRRSQSPPARAASSTFRSGSYANDHGSESTYPANGAPYNASSSAYSGNGYGAGSMGAPRSSGSTRERDFSRNGAEPSGYSRRP